MAESAGEASLGLCPLCRRGDLRLSHAEEDLPGYGRVLLLTYKCEACGYKANDLIPLESRQPASYKAKIESVEDLKVKVVRASSGFIEIPELGVEIKPGPASEGYITNVEGLLVRIEEAASTLKVEGEAKGNLKAFLERLERAMRGDEAFTVIVKDPFGSSALLSEAPGKVEKQLLSREEAERLRRELVGVALEYR